MGTSERASRGTTGTSPVRLAPKQQKRIASSGPPFRGGLQGGDTASPKQQSYKQLSMNRSDLWQEITTR